VKVPRKLLSFLKEKETFLIATHIDPEGDALGSALALSFALESLGKKTFLYDKDPVPNLYRFLPGYKKFANKIPASVSVQTPVILLDCNTLERAGIEGMTFRY